MQIYKIYNDKQIRSKQKTDRQTDRQIDLLVGAKRLLR